MSRWGFIGGLICSLAIFATAPGAWAQSATSSAPSTKPSDPRSVIPAEMAARYAHAKWTYPGSTPMADIYPPRAQDEEVQGIAVIACTIAADGHLDRCGIMAEEPKGYGFGLATATAFVKYCHVDPSTVDGGVEPGDFTVFTYKWTLG